MPDKEIAASRDALRGTKFVYIAASFAALGGLLFGYDTGVISGALIFIKREFGLTLAAEEIVVSGVLLGATLGAIVGGKAADLFGRRRLACDRDNFRRWRARQRRGAIASRKSSRSRLCRFCAPHGNDFFSLRVQTSHLN
jgi:hypothetical protein